MMRRRAELLLAGLVAVAVCLSGTTAFGEDDPKGTRETTGTTHGSAETAKSAGKATSGKSASKSKSTKGKKKKKKKKKVTRKNAMGLKVGLMPFNTMSADTSQGSKSYEMRMAYGIGTQFQYWLMKDLYFLGEVLYWVTEIDGRNVTISGDKPQDYNVKASDALLNLGVGLRYNVMGGEATKDRVFLRGSIGFTDYIAADENPEASNRSGLYYGFGGGIEHKLTLDIGVYADTGISWNSFTSGAGSNSAAKDEESALLWNWQVTGGFMYYWK
jgi:hypothetical protein